MLPASKPSDGSAVPASETAAGALDAAPIARLAFREPLRVFGAKAIAIWQLAPGCSVAPQASEVIRKSAALVPASVASAVAVVAGPLPSFRTVNGRGALTASTSLSANVAALGSTDSWAAPPIPVVPPLPDGVIDPAAPAVDPAAPAVDPAAPAGDPA